MNKEQARVRAWALYRDLEQSHAQDAEQEVMGVAVSALDGLLVACKQYVPEDPVVKRIDDLMSVEAIEAGSIRVADAKLVVHQLAMALGPESRITVSAPRGTIPGIGHGGR